MPAQELLTQQFPNDYLSQIVRGALFLAVLTLVPRGLIPVAGEKIASWRAKRSGGKPVRKPVDFKREAAAAQESGGAADGPAMESAR